MGLVSGVWREEGRAGEMALFTKQELVRLIDMVDDRFVFEVEAAAWSDVELTDFDTDDPFQHARRLAAIESQRLEFRAIGKLRS